MEKAQIMTFSIVRLGSDGVEQMRALNGLFGRAFDDLDSYGSALPSQAYLSRLLGREHVFALVAIEDDEVIGGLVAYALDKFEQARSEIYLYDLAVDEAHRRRGVARALIGRLQELAATHGAWVIFVQADHGDDPAIALYQSMGTREDVIHFDIAVAKPS